MARAPRALERGRKGNKWLGSEPVGYAMTMSSAMLTEATPTQDRRVRTALLELGLVTLIFGFYRSARSLTSGSVDRALVHAAHVIRLEQALGVFNERAVQGWVLGSKGLVLLLNRYYVLVHFPVTIAFLLWAYLRHLREYKFIRTWFALVTLAALVIHIVYPLAPPRMTGGFVDTLHMYGPQIYSVDPRQSVANQFAAMPSLHFGWAVMLAISVIAIKRTRKSLLVLIHPAITLFAIVATANHYWIDSAVAAMLVVLLGVFLVWARQIGWLAPVLATDRRAAARGTSDAERELSSLA